MRLLRALRVAIAAALVATACGGATPGAAPTKDPLAGRYTLSGGGGAIEPVQALTAAFTKIHPNVSWTIEDVGSDGGVSLTANKSVDLGMISRDLKDSEKGTVQALSIGVSGTGVVVNAANPVTGLTKDQVRKIYEGGVADWSQVGGQPGKITVLIRESGSATRSAFESYFFPGKPVYGKDVIEVYEIQETLKSLGSFKDSIGMVTIENSTLSEKSIKFLAIDGVPATKDNLSSGAYKIRRPLFLVYNNDPATVKPAVKEFIDFVRGPDGQKVLAGL
jgi:phosphate transport system substrate-binding protein